MSDNKQAINLTNDTLVAEVLLRIQAIENLLVSKGLLSKEELKKELNTVSGVVMKEILKKANVPGDLDALVETLNSTKNI